MKTSKTLMKTTMMMAGSLPIRLLSNQKPMLRKKSNLSNWMRFQCQKANSKQISPKLN